MRASENAGSRASSTLLGLVLLFCPACEPSSASNAQIERIVSLSPLASGLLVEMALVDRIVAVDGDSGRLPVLTQLPRIEAGESSVLAALHDVAPDLVIVGEAHANLAARVATSDVRVLVEAVHDFDDGFAFWEELATLLGVEETARARIEEAVRPLARISEESYGFTRPRVAVLESLDPLVLVGDHQFAGALVEIAGGESLTHGRGPRPKSIDRDSLSASSPELLVWIRPAPTSEAERASLARTHADLPPLVFIEFDPLRFFEPDAADAARTLRAAIASHARRRPPSP